MDTLRRGFSKGELRPFMVKTTFPKWFLTRAIEEAHNHFPKGCDGEHARDMRLQGVAGHRLKARTGGTRGIRS
jgi:hypothetical protein